jgi:thiamine biosynthesis lipoprotein
VRSAHTDFGGNIATLGARPDGSPWRIGIRHPRDAGRLIGAVRVADRTVVTSGTTRIFGRRTADGATYPGPHTARRLKTSVMSSYHRGGRFGGARLAATPVCVAGLEQGARILRRITGAQAVIVRPKSDRPRDGGPRNASNPRRVSRPAII